MSFDKQITPCDLRNLMDCSAVRLVDVRNYDEFESQHVKGAELVPLPRLCAEAEQWDKTEPLYVICQQGPRSKEAQETLIRMGFEKVTMVAGGTRQCAKEGLEVVCLRKRLSVQRQTFIVVGFMALTGLIVAELGLKWGLLLPLLAGCGLVFAGMTGFCPLALLIEKMPWNQSDKTQQISSSSVGNNCCETG